MKNSGYTNRIKSMFKSAVSKLSELTAVDRSIIDQDEAAPSTYTCEQLQVPAGEGLGCCCGDCCVYQSALYYTCEKSAACPRELKKQYFDGSMRSISNLEMFDFVKRYSYFENNMHDYDKAKVILFQYVDRYFPNLKKYREEIVIRYIAWEGMDPQMSPFISFLFEANEKCSDYENLGNNLNALYEIYRDSKYTPKQAVVAGLLKRPSILLKDPALFARNRKDFDYSYKVIQLLSDRNELPEYFYNTENIGVDLVFKEDGTLRPAGIGGPDIGESEDGIWNVIDKHPESK